MPYNSSPRRSIVDSLGRGKRRKEGTRKQKKMRIPRSILSIQDYLADSVQQSSRSPRKRGRRSSVSRGDEMDEENPPKKKKKKKKSTWSRRGTGPASTTRVQPLKQERVLARHARTRSGGRCAGALLFSQAVPLDACVGELHCPPGMARTIFDLQDYNRMGEVSHDADHSVSSGVVDASLGADPVQPEETSGGLVMYTQSQDWLPCEDEETSPRRTPIKRGPQGPSLGSTKNLQSES